jgi:outer membrane protein OmpA-like peptidoglycan-associated protein
MRLIARVVVGAVLIWTAYGSVASAQTDPSVIQPVEGLVITSTGRSTLYAAEATGQRAYNRLDQELWTSVLQVTPEVITYHYRIAAPSNVHADADARKLVIERSVRRADLVQSNRMTLLVSTIDPKMYGGQTFAETSAKTLQSLKAGADVPFVIGINEADDSNVMGAVATIGMQATSKVPAGGPLGNMGGVFMMLNTGRDYYRGTLRRVEAGLVKFSVLINGERTTVPAVHAAGSFTFGSKPAQHVDMWWLDNPAYPLTLQWKFGDVNNLVTRIDLPPTDTGTEQNSRVKGGVNAMDAPPGSSGLAAKLQKSCHAEVSGIYFNTGSAMILDESKPTLTAVAKLIKQSSFAALTIEGHTDSIGTADYNQDLSEKRAAAVRQTLVADYGVPAGRLAAKGYGLTRPVETNDTPEGRAHNRRVELSRPCGSQK